MKPYISLNNKYIAKTKKDSEKNQYKFLNNSVIGKTIQNNRKQRVIRLITNETTRSRFASSVNFNGKKYISDFLRIFEIKKTPKNSKMNLPIFVGKSVLAKY